MTRINQVLQTHPEQIFLRDRFLTFGLHRDSLSLQENAAPELKIWQTDECDYPTQGSLQLGLRGYFRGDYLYLTFFAYSRCILSKPIELALQLENNGWKIVQEVASGK